MLHVKVISWTVGYRIVRHGYIMNRWSKSCTSWLCHKQLVEVLCVMVISRTISQYCTSWFNHEPLVTVLYVIFYHETLVRICTSWLYHETLVSVLYVMVYHETLVSVLDVMVYLVSWTISHYTIFIWPMLNSEQTTMSKFSLKINQNHLSKILDIRFCQNIHSWLIPHSGYIF